MAPEVPDCMKFILLSSESNLTSLGLFSYLYVDTVSHFPNLTGSGRLYLISLRTLNQHTPVPPLSHVLKMLLCLQSLTLASKVPLPQMPGT